jgi:hypothetical protein
MDSLLDLLGLDKKNAKLLKKVEAFMSEKEEIDFNHQKILLHFLNLDLGYDQEQLRKALNIISKSEELTDALNFLTYAIVIKAHPSEHLIYTTPKLKSELIDFELFNLIAILSLIEPSIKSYKQRGIDQKHITFNLGHLKGYIKNFYNKNNKLGIENFGWTTYLASLGLIQIKSLNFMHHIYTDPFYGFKHKKTHAFVMIVHGNKDINHLGQFSGTNDIKDVDFQTSYEETKTFYEGYIVDPKGYILNQKVKLYKRDWQLVIDKDTFMIDFHIPTKTPYKIKDIQDSFLEAKTFFNKHFSEYTYQGFWCVSWLYAPQTPQYIKNINSNILNIYQQGYVCPSTIGASALYSFVFHDEHPDFSKVEPKTTLEKNIITYISNGNHINCGLYIVLLDDMKHYGETYYQHQFLKLKKTIKEDTHA